MPSTNTTEIADAVYFRAVQERVITELHKAIHSIGYVRGEFESLTTEQALPPEYRKAYRQMADSLLRTEQAIRDAAAANVELEVDSGKFEALQHDMAASSEVVSTVRRSIEEVNAAELRLIRHCESQKAAMREHDVSGQIDWGMPFDYDFAILLDASPERAFYETCDHGEPLWISVGSYPPHMQRKDEASDNRNIFAGHVDHPLRHDHHGYLVRRIIEHMAWRWELISNIREVMVTLEFCTTETAWTRSAGPLADNLGQSDES